MNQVIPFTRDIQTSNFTIASGLILNCNLGKKYFQENGMEFRKITRGKNAINLYLQSTCTYEFIEIMRDHTVACKKLRVSVACQLSKMK